MYQLFPTATLEWMPPRKLYTPKKYLDIAFPSLRRKSKKETLVLEPHVGEAVTSLSTQIAPRQPERVRKVEELRLSLFERSLE